MSYTVELYTTANFDIIPINKYKANIEKIPIPIF